MNTGGTSGQPLSFYVDHNAWAREWAHMHLIWSQLNYRTSDLKLTLRGKDHGGNALVYNAVHNELSVNAYSDKADVCDILEKYVRTGQVKYLHGYPSAVSEFVSYTKVHSPILLARLKQSIKGVLLGSEYPAPHYRRLIEAELSDKTLSWYGHSEMAILATEQTEKYRYYPMHTYGLCEAVQTKHTASLVGTSFWNLAAPLIRYATGDIVTGNTENGLLSSFEITEGRVGEFVLDRGNRKVSLTALIFGRHHELFSVANSIQVRQTDPGFVQVFVVPNDISVIANERLASLFNDDNVDIEFKFEIAEKPFRTRAGKTPLLIPSNANYPKEYR